MCMFVQICLSLFYFFHLCFFLKTVGFTYLITYFSIPKLFIKNSQLVYIYVPPFWQIIACTVKKNKKKQGKHFKAVTAILQDEHQSLR